jgi:hypothetical protein
MRCKPVTRDEVCFNGKRITTAPMDAVEGPYDWRNPAEFKPLWEPLMYSLGVSMPPSWELREAAPCHQCGKSFWQNYRSRGFFWQRPLRQPRPSR